MKRISLLFLTIAFTGVLRLAQGQPTITAPPASRTNNVGDNARFSVTASGTGTLLYQWKFAGDAIDGATTNQLNLLVTNANQAGNYTVVVTDDVGPVESSAAVLSIPYGDRTRIVQWNFNSTTPDGNEATGVFTPSFGTGTLPANGIVGNMAGNNWLAGSPSDAAALGNDNSGRSLTGPSSTGTANKTAGFRFDASTLGYKDIVVTWEQYAATRACAYWRGQYTTNGTDWIERVVVNKRDPFTALGGPSYTFHFDDLSEVAGVKNNPSFAYRIVGEHQFTATGSGSTAYVPADVNNTYNTGGPSRWDMVTVLGTVDNTEEQPVITTQPQSQTNYVGGTAAFNVVATGGNLRYSWRFEDENILQQTNSTLVLTNVQLTNAGSYSVLVTNSAGFVISDVAVLTVQEAPPAGDRHWSADGDSLGGAGTWDATTPNRWGLEASGPFPFPWNNNMDSAIFGGTAGAVALGEDITVNKITSINGYSVTGGNTITFSGDGAGVNITGTGNSITFSCKLTGSILTKTGSGQIFLSNNGNTVGKYLVNAGTLASSVGNLGAPGALVADFITLNGGNLGFEATSVNLGANRGIYLGTNNGLIAARSGATVTFGAPLTGPGGVVFPSSNFGQGNTYGANNIPYIFSNPNNDYQGNTTVARGELRLGANEVLPDTTTVTISGANGQLNLNGKTETVAGIIVNGSGSRITDTAGNGILNVTGTFDLRQSGSGSQGIVGVLSGAGNLIKTTANTVELSGINSFTGATILSAGTLALTGSGSFANSPAILIALDAILDVTGRTDGTLALGGSQVLSGAGAVSGAVSVSGTVSPGSSIGTLNTGPQIWNGGGTYEWEVANVSGVPGTDWDNLNITGDLDVQATSGSRFTIKVVPSDDITGFDSETAQTWAIASLSGAITNFDAGQFTINDSAVTNDLAGGVFAPQPGVGVLNLTYSPNPGPVASPRNVTRAKGISVKIPIATLLAQSTSHADGSARELVSVGAAQHGSVTTNNSYIYYVPDDDSDDSFTYTVKDLRSRPGDTVRTAQSSINITVVNAVGSSKTVTVNNGVVTASFAGVPGYSYQVQRSTNLDSWVTLSTMTAPAGGLFEFVDNFSDLDEPPASAFYRLRQP